MTTRCLQIPSRLQVKDATVVLGHRHGVLEQEVLGRGLYEDPEAVPYEGRPERSPLERWRPFVNAARGPASAVGPEAAAPRVKTSSVDAGVLFQEMGKKAGPLGCSHEDNLLLIHGKLRTESALQQLVDQARVPPEPIPRPFTVTEGFAAKSAGWVMRQMCRRGENGDSQSQLVGCIIVEPPYTSQLVGRASVVPVKKKEEAARRARVPIAPDPVPVQDGAPRRVGEGAIVESAGLFRQCAGRDTQRYR